MTTSVPLRENRVIESLRHSAIERVYEDGLMMIQWLNDPDGSMAHWPNFPFPPATTEEFPQN